MEYSELYRTAWPLGLKMTRLYNTCLAQANGYHGSPLSIGCVRTPLLGLIVNRDREIENFVSKPFWTLEASIAVEKDTLTALWKPNETQEIATKTLRPPL